MKKIILSFAAAMAMFAMVSCSSNADKIKDIYKDGTEQLKNCDGDTEKRNEIIKDTETKVADVIKDMGADALKLADNDEVVNAKTEFLEAAGNDIQKSAEDAAAEMQKKMKGL